MKISFEVLQVLDAIDRTGTFASAAESLYRVPSSLTYLVQKLESDLEVTLFERSGRRAKLTQAGRVLVEDGRRLLQAAEALESKVQRVQQGWEAQLRIGIDEIIPFDMLWEHVGQFYDLHMSTRLQLSREVLGGSWDALVTRRVDLIVGASGDIPNIANLVTRPIGTLKHVFVVDPRHPLASMPEPLSLETVAMHRAVAIGDTSRELAPRSIGLTDGQDVLTVPTLEIKLAAQIRGLASGTLPECVASGPIRRGELVEKKVSGIREHTQCYLAWREGETGKAMQWWIEQLDRPDLIDLIVQHRRARG